MMRSKGDCTLLAVGTLEFASNIVINKVDFIGTPGGDLIVVPDNAAGPVMARNRKGILYEGGQGGNELQKSVTDVRILEPTVANGHSPGYPYGYATYHNKYGHPVHPCTGETNLPGHDSWRHIQFSKPQ